MAGPAVNILDVSLGARSIGTLTRLDGDQVLFAFNQECAR
jgi:hypothetical protein